MPEREKAEHISRWAVEMKLFGKSILLFGCTEDIRCTCDANADMHLNDLERHPFVRLLCPRCEVPVCSDCWSRMDRYKEAGCIPMSLSNDHYYGHVNRFLVENAVTWLECAAASVCWSTMLVYYLEDPYGHLMDEVMGQAQGRTKVRGNLFSFTMPWEDIEQCCRRSHICSWGRASLHCQR